MKQLFRPVNLCHDEYTGDILACEVSDHISPLFHMVNVVVLRGIATHHNCVALPEELHWIKERRIKNTHVNISKCRKFAVPEVKMQEVLIYVARR